MLFLNYDFRFIEITHELYALEKYIVSIEQQLPDLIKAEEQKAYENLNKNGYENEESELQIMRQELYELIDVTLPKYFWGQAIVTLWAIFESAIAEIATEVKTQKELELGLTDLQGDVIHRTNKYFNHILKLPIDTRSKSWQHLRMMYVLRNAIAHANGRLENVKSQKDVKKILKWIGSDLGIDEIHGSIILTPDFVKRTHAIIFELLNGLISEVKQQFPKQIKPKNIFKNDA